MAANSSQAPQSSNNSAAIRNMNEQLDAYILWRTQLPPPPPPPQVRAAHNQNIYQCQYCPRTFASAQALGGHLNAHRTERNAERAFALRQRRLARLRQTPFVFVPPPPPPPVAAAPPFLNYPAPLAFAPPPAVQVGPNYGLTPWFYPGVGCYVYNHNYGYGNNHGYYYGYGAHHATPVPGFHPGGPGYLTRFNRDHRDNRSNIPNRNDHEVSLFELIFGPEREAMAAAGEGTSGGDGDGGGDEGGEEGGDEGVPLKRTRKFF